jgi:flagellar protein FliS
MFTFATPSAPGQMRNLAGAYASVGIETSVSGASPHRLIELLFNGFVDSIGLARAAMRSGQIEQKGKSISRAARILEEGLKAGLNLQEGGRLAEDLSLLYSYIAVRLTYANRRNDEAALDECLRLINPLREAWISIGPKVEGQS